MTGRCGILPRCTAHPVPLPPSPPICCPSHRKLSPARLHSTPPRRWRHTPPAGIARYLPATSYLLAAPLPTPRSLTWYRYEGVLVLIWRELLRAIFVDFTPDLPGSGAKVYSERNPYFLEAKRLREQCDEAERLMRKMKAQRDAELASLKGRNEMINKTLGAWNRALGHSQGSAEADDLRARIEALEKLLQEASSEVARLHEEAYKDPVAKCERTSSPVGRRMQQLPRRQSRPAAYACAHPSPRFTSLASPPPTPTAQASRRTTTVKRHREKRCCRCTSCSRSRARL